MKRIMGLDFGSNTIGVALSDPFGWTAQGLEVIRREDPAALRKSLDRLAALAKEHDVGVIVLGFPKNMDNSPSARCEITLAFKEKLEKRLKDIPVVLQDERLSTVEAERRLIEADVSRKGRKQIIDRNAAAIILQRYLDARLANS